jgi:hypothetical protein
MKMKKLPIVLACTLLMLVLVPSLHAAPPAPVSQAELAAQIFAPAGAPATATPADPVKAGTSGLLPAPRLLTNNCTYVECISECDDCPWGHTNYCLSLVTCECGCR